MYLFELDFNWADEIDFHESCIMDQDEINDFKKTLKVFKSAKLSTSLMVGSNQEHEIDANNVSNMYSITEATKDTIHDGFGGLICDFIESIDAAVQEYESVPKGVRAETRFKSYKDKLEIITQTLNKTQLKYTTAHDKTFLWYNVILTDYDVKFSFYQLSGYQFGLKCNDKRIRHYELKESSILEFLVSNHVQYDSIINENYQVYFEKTIALIKSNIEKYEAIPTAELKFKDVYRDLVWQWPSLSGKQFMDGVKRYNYSIAPYEAFKKEINSYKARAKALENKANELAIVKMKKRILDGFKTPEAFLDFMISTGDLRTTVDVRIQKYEKENETVPTI